MPHHDIANELPPETRFYVEGRTITDVHGDTHLVGQMYVRSHPGADPTLTPIVLFHGGAQTGYFYEHAPDGGPGFAQLLARPRSDHVRGRPPRRRPLDVPTNPSTDHSPTTAPSSSS